MKLIQKDGIDIILKNTKDTPRTAVCLFFSIDEPEKYAGVYPLFAKLLLKGTKTRTAEQIAEIVESNGIETSVKCKRDYLKISTLFLNEDFELALDVVRDIVQNSTFDEFEKEVFKFKGEIVSDLDSPQLKAFDAFMGGIFENHYYGNSYTRILEDLDKIQKQDVMKVLDLVMGAKKAIAIAGDFKDEDKVVDYFVKNFSFMKSGNATPKIASVTEYNGINGKDKIIKIVKNDAKQAQIFQGRIVSTRFSEDYPKLCVLNNILGSSGLSSRFFVELRDKQGLAYTVRSALDPARNSALMYFYIGTEPKNIEKSLNGFKTEVQRIIDTPPDDVELTGGKENILGRLEYFSQTNIQLASTYGSDYIAGYGLDFQDKFKEKLMLVNKEDVSEMAKKYLQNPSVISILAPEENLKQY